MCREWQAGPNSQKFCTILFLSFTVAKLQYFLSAWKYCVELVHASGLAARLWQEDPRLCPKLGGQFRCMASLAIARCAMADLIIDGLAGSPHYEVAHAGMPRWQITRRAMLATGAAVVNLAQTVLAAQKSASHNSEGADGSPGGPAH